MFCNKKNIVLIGYLFCLALIFIGCSKDSDELVNGQFKIITSELEGGSINITPKQDLYEKGTEVEIEAVPEEDWQFDGWSGDLSGDTNPKKIIITADIRVIAKFSNQINPEQANINHSLDQFAESIRNNKETELVAVIDDNIESNVYGNITGLEFSNEILDLDYLDFQIKDRIVSIEDNLATVNGWLYQEVIYPDFEKLDLTYYPEVEAVINNDIDTLSSILNDNVSFNWWENGEQVSYSKDEFINFIVSSDYWESDNYWHQYSSGCFEVLLSGQESSKNVYILKTMSSDNLSQAVIDKISIYILDNPTYISENDVFRVPVEIALTKEDNLWKINKFNYNTEAYDFVNDLMSNIENAIELKDSDALQNTIPIENVKWINNGKIILCSKEEFIDYLINTDFWGYNFSEDYNSISNHSHLDTVSNVSYSQNNFGFSSSLDSIEFDIVLKFSIEGNNAVIDSIEFIKQDLKL